MRAADDAPLTRLARGPELPRWSPIDGERALLAVVALYVGLFCVLPLGRLFAEALAPGGEVGPGLIADVLGSRAARRAAWNTLEAGLGATALSVLLGTAMALLIGLTDLRARAVLVFLLLLPLLIPAQVTAIAWLQLMSPASPVLGFLGLAPAPGSLNPLYGRGGIVLLMGIEHATIVFLAVTAGLRAVPADLIEAARAAGARPPRVAATVVLPLLRPAVIAGAALAFVSAIGNFGIPALLGIPGRYSMLTTLIYQRLNGFGPSVLGEVAVLAFVLAGFAAAGLAVQALAGRGMRAPLEAAGASARGAPFRLGRLRPAVEAAVWAVLLAISILPLLALVSTSLIPALGVPLGPDTVTASNYAYALFRNSATQRAFANSFALALGAAVAAVAVSVPLGYLVVFRRNALARGLNAVADAPFALPGIVLAIACILVFLRPLPLLGVSLYGTIWILLVAYLGRFLALGLRPTIAGLALVERSLEEAAQMAGAGPVRRLFGIVLPVAAPAAAAGGLLIFMTAFNELTVSALLWSSGNETLGVLVFQLYDQGNSTAAAAVAVLTVVATLGVALAATAAARAGDLPRGVLPWQA